MASSDADFHALLRPQMRTTIALNDELVAKAQEYTGIQEKSRLMDEALRVLIAREAQRRFVLLGGSDPKAKAGPRRRSKPA
jgi:Arc/MetJ family transcription regulator